MQVKKNPGPLCALDLEKWRIQHGLTIAAACDLLGLSHVKWVALSKNPTEPIQDATVCMLITLYDQYPETLPIRRAIDFLSFMLELGYQPDVPVERKQCASSLGREGVAAYRWLDGINPPSRPVERLMEAIQRLPTQSGRKKRRILENAAKSVAEQMGVLDPVAHQSWRAKR